MTGMSLSPTEEIISSWADGRYLRSNKNVLLFNSPSLTKEEVVLYGARLVQVVRHLAERQCQVENNLAKQSTSGPQKSPSARQHKESGPFLPANVTKLFSEDLTLLAHLMSDLKTTGDWDRDLALNLEGCGCLLLSALQLSVISDSACLRDAVNRLPEYLQVLDSPFFSTPFYSHTTIFLKTLFTQTPIEQVRSTPHVRKHITERTRAYSEESNVHLELCRYQ